MYKLERSDEEGLVYVDIDYPIRVERRVVEDDVRFTFDGSVHSRREREREKVQKNGRGERAGIGAVLWSIIGRGNGNVLQELGDECGTCFAARFDRESVSDICNARR